MTRKASKRYRHLARLSHRQLGARGDTDDVRGKVASVDRYTLGHGLIGVLLGMWGMPWWLSAGVAIGWEVIENPLKRAAPGLFPDGRPDTYGNSAIDVAAWMVGHGAGRLLMHGEPVSKIWR